MKTSSILQITAFVIASITFLLNPFAQPALAQNPTPANDPARGLIYDGLQPASSTDCKKGYTMKLSDGTTMCVAEPDPIPTNIAGRAMNGVRIVNPVATTATPVVCDGDGVSGYRVQILYVRPASVPSNYATYLNSFRQWAADADKYYSNSAAQTGGIRNIRFVTDQTCYPVVVEAVISDSGASTFSGSVSELRAQGFNRADRDYMIFMDGPRYYCGISNIYTDDSAAQTNINNNGPRYGRIDNTCWSGVIAAHELTHNLGGVQSTAPNSDGNWHCKDGYDLMCDYGTSPLLTLTVCPDSAFNYILDCKHDDYFNTNPAPGSYLATHWNVANSRFLINNPQIRIDALATGKMVSNVYTTSDTFNPGDTVTVRAHIVDQNGANYAGATINVTVNQPNGAIQCNLTLTSDSAGNSQGDCVLPKMALAGTWVEHVASFSRAPFTSNSALSIIDHNFSVNGTAPTAVTLSSFSAQADASAITSNTMNIALGILVSALAAGLVWQFKRLATAHATNKN